MNNNPTCNARKTSYRNGKSFEECKDEAAVISEQIAQKIQNNGEVSWSYLLEYVNHDELIYKLTLKYLKQKGHDIGNNKIPRIKFSRI
ncbi:MAG: hypothetical protein ACE5SW_09685 [Nitrososphaeraceae archaeon]